MTFSKSLFTVMLAGLSLTACKKEESKTTETASVATPVAKKEIAPENLATASFQIEGMTCAMGCAATIEKKITETEGIKEAKVDFESKTATVSFDKTINNEASLTKLVEGVADGKTYKVANYKSAI
ncbi:heavy metal-associated domain-containing protein [Flavobacterium sp.]|uniref:heavy-metal-associated domain-containing protein n=1 Tax=Flavobacterium sp. TaxID=239 RepID=UPI0028BDD15C|nr:heavy metal-associated domain-containing protein [Flavobacterium sp.]